MSTLAENHLIALEAFAHFGDGSPVQGAAEVLRRCVDPKLTAREARALYETIGKSGTVQLAKRLLPIHKDSTVGNLAARVNISEAETARIIDAIPKSESKEPADIQSDWSSIAARKWLFSYARSLSSEAKYIRENASGFAENEDEFRCGLANGLGIDDEDEQTEIIKKIHKEKGMDKIE